MPPVACASSTTSDVKGVARGTSPHPHLLAIRDLEKTSASSSDVRIPFASTAPRWRQATALGELRAMVSHSHHAKRQRDAVVGGPCGSARWAECGVWPGLGGLLPGSGRAVWPQLRRCPGEGVGHRGWSPRRLGGGRGPP